MYELIFTNLTSGVKIQEWWFSADIEKRLLFLSNHKDFHVEKVDGHNPRFLSKEYFRLFWKCLKHERIILYIPKIGT